MSTLHGKDKRRLYGHLMISPPVLTLLIVAIVVACRPPGLGHQRDAGRTACDNDDDGFRAITCLCCLVEIRDSSKPSSMLSFPPIFLILSIVVIAAHPVIRPVSVINETWSGRRRCLHCVVIVVVVRIAGLLSHSPSHVQSD